MSLQASGGWVKKVLRAADAELTGIRASGHPDAAGLVIAIDHNHARGLSEALKRETGRECALVLSDDSEASDKIDAFAKGTGRWIVAVRMVSEGIDIPRLRVGVYATNILTEMYFRQAVGRFVRAVKDLEEQSAYIYIPADQRLLAMAEKIKEERDHELLQEYIDKLEADAERDTSSETGSENTQPGSAIFISADAECGVTVHDGILYAPDLIEESREKAKRHGIPCNPAALAALIMEDRRERGELQNPPVNPDWPAASGGVREAGTRPTAAELTTSEQQKRLRAICKRLVARYRLITGDEYANINNRLNKLIGVHRVEECTIEQLKRRKDLLQEWISENGG